MPRKARVWTPQGIFHVDVRAHSGAPIFARAEDRRMVETRAAEVFAEAGIRCLAGAILRNHAHFLVRSEDHPGHAMLRLNTSIARRIRIRHGGEGAVFQGRFFSGLCTDDGAVMTRLAYVTGNPVHHRVLRTIDALKTYRWSTLGETLGLREPRLTDPAATLGLLHEDPRRARAALLRLLRMWAKIWAERCGDLARDEPPDDTMEIDRRMCEELGLPRTLRAVGGAIPGALSAVEAAFTRRALLRTEGWTLQTLIGTVCILVGARERDLVSGRRDAVTTVARAVVAHVACDHLRWPGVDVARAVGATPTAVSMARRRGASEVARLGLTSAEIVARSRRAAG